MRELRLALKSKIAPRSVAALLLALALPVVAGAAEIIPVEQERSWSRTERTGSQVDTETESAPDFGHFEGGTYGTDHTSDILPRELRGELNAWGSQWGDWGTEGYWSTSGWSRYRVEFDIDVTVEYELTADLYTNDSFFGVTAARLTLSIFDTDWGGYDSLWHYDPGDGRDLIFETGTLEVGRYELEAYVYGGSTTHSAMGMVSGDSHASFSLVVSHPSFPVEIDIEPRSEHNLVYPLSRRLIPVALLGSEDFDVADVDVTTLAFGPDGAPPAFDLTNPWVYWLAHRDVNRDGKRDLLSHYRTPEAGIAEGDSLVTCWGEDYYGQSTVPAGLVNPSAIAAGGYNTCAIDDTGVICWGQDSYGQATVPGGLVNPIAISAGYRHTCAIDDTGVICWGSDSYGQATVPGGLVSPIAISAGYRHTCAIDDTGVICWGSDSYGQVTVPGGLVSPIAISAGYRHTCAIDDNGVTCWGDDSEVQLTPPEDLISPSAIAAGSRHTCAIYDNAEACLTGETLDAVPFEGCDHIETVSKCGRGFEVALLLPPLMWLRRRRRSRKP
jgi:hypothetical protein